MLSRVELRLVVDTHAENQIWMVGCLKLEVLLLTRIQRIGLEAEPDFAVGLNDLGGHLDCWVGAERIELNGVLRA